MRERPDYVALTCAAVYLLAFLFLPFYQITVLGFSGLTLMQYSVVLCLPLIAGVLMALACLFTDARIGIAIGAVSLILIFILLAAGNSVLLQSNALTGFLSSLINSTLGFNLTSAVPIGAGLGGIFAILSAVVYTAAEVYEAIRKPSGEVPPGPDPFFDTQS